VNSSMTASLFRRFLGIIYAAAFLSLAVQLLGLVGENGIVPAKTFLEAIFKRFGAEAYYRLPTLAWFSAADGFLLGLAWAGVLLSVFVILDVFPCLIFALLWVLYLSLVQIGQVFLSFQWDVLLLETGFLAIFLTKNPSKGIVWLFRILLFKLMFSSGMVKLLSGDPAWRNLTALTFHYETTPLPVWVGWYFHHLPVWFHKGSVIVMYFTEIILPFFIFLGRRARMLCFVGQVVFQLLIMLTGNYAFFNLLAIALCVFLLESGRGRQVCHITQPMKVKTWHPGVRYLFVGVMVILNLMQLSQTLRLRVPWPGPLAAMRQALYPLHIVNGYGLFAVMTKKRGEIILQGSKDGKQWRDYEFKWKPGDPSGKPAFVQPHQPRLDWQMWFASLSTVRRNPWLVALMRQILLGSPEVLRLLKTDPFEQEPPRYLQAAFFDYHFSDPKTRRETGKWWQRTQKGMYAPRMVRTGKTVYFLPQKSS